MTKAIDPKAVDGCLVPGGLYRLDAFYARMGIGESKRISAKRAGVELRTIGSGKRRYVRGEDGIEFILRLEATC